MTRILAIDGSPTGPGRTRTVLDAVLAAARAESSDSDPVITHVVELGGGADAVAAAVAEAENYDTFVLGAPAYRAAPAAPLKAFLDALPRGFWGEKTQPMTARAVGLVMTGATFHHYLALDSLRSVVAGFFAAHVLSPGLYVPGEGFTEQKELTDKVAALAAGQGAALVALSRAIAASEALQAVRPQA